MYSRSFDVPPARIVESGKAHFGTFTGVSPRFDIKGMRAPYAGIPLPSIISDIRIKSRLNYYFSIEKYIGLVEFFDFKIIGLAEICFWDKASGKKIRIPFHNANQTSFYSKKHRQRNLCKLQKIPLHKNFLGKRTRK